MNAHTPLTVLVTGATGFVGSHTLQALSTRDDLNVIAACRTPAKLSVDGLNEVRVGDMNDPDFRTRALRDVDVVIHCAAWTAVWGHAEESNKRHLQPSLAFIDEALEAGVKRFIHVSSTALSDRTTHDDPMCTGETTPFFPHLHNVQKIEEYMRAQSNRGTVFINMRLGFFIGSNYGLGILPMLLPRLKTHLVPWVKGGQTRLPLIDGRDIAQAMMLAVTAPDLKGYESFHIIGPQTPTVHEIISFVHHEFGYPKPHFSVPFPVAYAFAWLMEKMDPIVWWEPLVTRSIIHFMEDKSVTNARAQDRLGYEPHYGWRSSVRTQITEMNQRQHKPMSMISPART